MKKIKNADKELSWKLVWDSDTKDVLFLKEIEGKFQIVDELNLFETKNKDDIYDKIKELGLKYDPSIQEPYESEWS